MADHVTVTKADSAHRVALDLYDSLRHLMPTKSTGEEAIQAHIDLFLKCRSAVIMAKG